MRRFPVIALAAAAALGSVCFGLAGAVAPAPAAAEQHRSYLRIGDSAGVKRIKLGLNKATIVELPRPAREMMIPNPEKLDAVLQTSTRAYLIGKQIGEANVLFVDKDGRQIASVDITIERDLSGLSSLLNRLLPGSNITVETLGERTVLTGYVTSPVDAPRACQIVTSYLGKLDQEQPSSGNSTSISISRNNNPVEDGGAKTCDPANVINLLSVEGREQVLLKVSVVEMERNIVKQFGVDLNALVNTGNFAFAALSSLPFPLSGPRGIADLGVRWMKSGNEVSGVLRALEENGLLHTLAEPNLTAISGETANFLAGGEFPIPVSQSAGTGPNNTAISVEFKKFGVGLAFTPVVMSEGRISLKVSTEVSELTTEGAVIMQGIAIPALKVRRAETTVELPSGGSLVMAGLLSDQSKQLLNGYPGVKNLPILGALFRSRDFVKKETELVVIVTPYVAKPVARSQLAQPDDGFGWASDLNTDVLLGQMNRVYGRQPERAPIGRFDGDVGFIVE